MLALAYDLLLKLFEFNFRDGYLDLPKKQSNISFWKMVIKILLYVLKL